jgi:DNA adenine methylase
LFSWRDQERLARSLDRARRRGVQIICTNADHRSIRDLYAQHFRLQPVRRFSGISAARDSRKEFTELLITANT